MKPDPRQLLGGYATGNLTPEERELLFTAALKDQEVFNSLAEEEDLRGLLADPEFRGELLEETDPANRSAIAAADFTAADVTARIPTEALGELPPPLRSAKSRGYKSTRLGWIFSAAVAAALGVMLFQVFLPRPEPSSSPIAAVQKRDVETVIAPMDAPPTLEAKPTEPSALAHFTPPAARTSPVGLPAAAVRPAILHVNGSILTLGIGTDAGVRIGNRFRVVRANADIGEVKITSTTLRSSMGTFSGSQTAQKGDELTPIRK